MDSERTAERTRDLLRLQLRLGERLESLGNDLAGLGSPLAAGTEETHSLLAGSDIKEELAELPEIRIDRVIGTRQRILSGFYDRPEILDAVAVAVLHGRRDLRHRDESRRAK